MSELNAVVEFINNPTINKTSQEISNLIQPLMEKNINLIYDGLTYCQLSGEIIGKQKKVELKLPDNQTFSVLQEQLKKIIETNCFINGIFDPFYSTLYGVQFIQESQKKQAFTDPINIEITDDILRLVYEDKFDKIKEDNSTKNFYEESHRNLEDFVKTLPIKCHKTQKEIQILKDGFNIQSLWFSLEGALKLLETNKEVFFTHQCEFLDKYKKMMQI
ncbi:unnamed protein product (macronuclear) [Paramecium tetraurelia]|uniref:Uncharacterized protein n=1 Tax=Paramecium tetraurelia TaxID=5888 RepID=A0CZT8_PARTE|nr:uncharacterized protein GSPATT00011878001 [Paramecium tetraurelia]CAK76305.1 unnamed protein product [Paramecium tetraurelia]|eukprot:XP_001443702.1 hypothetical protein (macronuclear) [Paramecium tetraurelia strain d4-2]